MNDVVNLNLRLPPDVHAEMERLSKKHDRSINSEVIQACRAWIEEYAECADCHEHADVFCKICNDGQGLWLCAEHYAERHLSDDEADEN
jgi:hypothetical protein